MTGFDVVVGAGSLRSARDDALGFPHRWTGEGVTVEATFTGAHLLHLSVAGCVLNDVYREAELLGVEIAGVRVTATGDFDTESWQSSGITYRVELDSPGAQESLDELLAVVDAVAEIPRRPAGLPVARI